MRVRVDLPPLTVQSVSHDVKRPMNDRTSELLDAACRVIARAGAARLRMSDVAREADVSTALVHYYFATRPDLLRAAFLFADARVDAHVDELIAGLDTAAERLERLLGVYVADGDELMRENSILWREMWSHAVFDGSLRAAVEESYADWLDQVQTAIADAVAEGSATTDDVDGASHRLAAIVDGLSSRLALGMLTGARAGELVRDALAIELHLSLPSPHTGT
jgi:AcrR family transcriptional regulator